MAIMPPPMGPRDLKAARPWLTIRCRRLSRRSAATSRWPFQAVESARERNGRLPPVVSGVQFDNIVVIGHIHSNMDVADNIKMTHRRITPALGRRIIDSALYNGDSVPDVILATAHIAVGSRRTTDTTEVAAEFERQGQRIDRSGWLAFED